MIGSPWLLVIALAVTLLSGCGEATTTSSPASSTVPATPPLTLPDDLPLGAGWPSAGQIGADGERIDAARDLPAMRVTFCDRDVSIAESAGDRLEASLNLPEDCRAREVLAFADRAAALAAALAAQREVLATARVCPEHRDDDFFLALTRVARLWPGSQSVLGHYEFVGNGDREGEPAVGVSVLNLLRRGNVLILSSVGTEGSGPASARSHAKTDLRELAPLVGRLED